MSEHRSHQNEDMVKEIMTYGTVLVRILPDGTQKHIPREFWVPEYVPTENKDQKA